MNDAADQARQIALSVKRQREAGHAISDEEVLGQYPQLREELLIQLQRLQMLAAWGEGAAAPRGEGPTASDAGDGASSDDVTGGDDIRMTLVEEPELDALRSTEALSWESPPVPHQPAKSGAADAYRPMHRPPMGLLKVYHDGMRSCEVRVIVKSQFVLGRDTGDYVVPHDPQVSGRHAEIQRRQYPGGRWRWHLVDLDSTNGTFVRVDRARLKHDDELFLGGERYLVRESPTGFALQHVMPEREGECWQITNDVWLGRNPQTELMPMHQDRFMDVEHARLAAEPDASGSVRWTITDNQSRNGIWLRVSEIGLTRSCAFQLGEQRFGFAEC